MLSNQRSRSWMSGRFRFVAALSIFALTVSCGNQQISGAGALGDEVSTGSLSGQVTLQQLQAVNYHKCVASPASAVDGSAPILTTCGTTSDQLWTLSGSSVALAGGLCLTAKDGATTTGTPVILSSCKDDSDAAHSNQNFVISGKNLVWGGRNLCVEVVTTSSTDQGGTLELFPCNFGAPEQAFTAVTPAGLAGIGTPQSISTTAGYVTSHDLTTSLQKTTLTASATGDVTIALTPATSYQTMTGFGASLTDASSFLIGSKMAVKAQNSLMARIFNPDAGIGLTIMRQPMGASDFSSVGNFSYDDAAGDDMALGSFSIAQDLKYTIPLLKVARQVDPSLFILATPWSAPAWMKNNNSMNGSGNAGLRPAAYDAFAQYFIKTYTAYQAAGVTIDAFAPQNEPLNAQGGYPTMAFNADSEAQFIATNLGPALKAAAPKAQIFGYDHNWDRPDYPTTLLNNASSAPYVSGVAFHCYAGNPSAMTDFHNKFPNEDIHMTECAGGGWQSDPLANTIDLLINSSNNWAKSVVLWNLALDPSGGPTNGGCPNCRGVVTIDGDNNGKVTYNPDYYALGHFSKFVRPGAAHIKSVSSDSSVTAAAFKNTNNSLATVIHNSGDDDKNVVVQNGTKSFVIKVPGNGIATVLLAGSDAG